MKEQDSVYRTLLASYLLTKPITATTAYTKKLLIVERDATLRILLRHAFKPDGYNVFEAATAQMAFHLFLEVEPQVVLMDAALSDTDGITLLCKLRQIRPKARILMTGNFSNARWAEAALMHGANGYITKPFTVRAIRQSIAQQIDYGQAPLAKRE